MAATAIAAYGTVLKLATVQLDGIKSISGPSVTIDMLDTTAHDTADGYRTFVEGLADGGEVTIEVVFDDTNEAKFQALDRKGSVTAMEITFPGAIVWAANCLMSGLEPNAPVDGEMTATVTFKITGAITFDPP